MMKKFCKTCQAETERSNTEGKCKACVCARTKAWRLKNYERSLASVESWQKANPEKVKKYKEKWSVENRDKKLAKDAAYRETYPEKMQAFRDKWREANPDAGRRHASNRRARKRENGGSLSVGLSEKLLKLQKGKCACCKEVLNGKFHLDHHIPLALGGANEDGNIQLLCPPCNMAKGAKHPVDFMQSRGFLL